MWLTFNCSENKLNKGGFSFKSKLKLLILLILFFLILPITFWLASKRIFFFPKAKGINANIVVDSSLEQGVLEPIWQALAQGGEEKYPFDNIKKEILDLNPKYIRVDHIYDFYNVVTKKNNQLFFNWKELDIIVDQILAVGALPFLSLSYMPPEITLDGNITSLPADWNDWMMIVQETIQHFSGVDERNLSNVYYEVWNEPDLFGKWTIGREKDYLLLYRYAVQGASKVNNVNSFKIGGPSTTAPYKNWVDKFLTYVFSNNLRIDFYSWHRYSLNPNDFLDDVNRVDAWLFQNASYTLPKFLTEWGSSSENSSFHDQPIDAAHLVATIRNLIQRVDLFFTFEIKDGLSPEGKKYWGRWGLLTHESAGEIEKKPKYYALQLLNKMKGNRVSLEGEGTWITGFAGKDGKTIRIILTNFDESNNHSEVVPVKINHLENGNYIYQENFLRGRGRILNETTTNGSIEKKISLSPNNIVLIELTKT